MRIFGDKLATQNYVIQADKMNKQIFAVLSLICGLLGFNLIAIAQTMTYMQIKNYALSQPDLDPNLFAVAPFYKIISVVLGLSAIIFCYLYSKSPDRSARLFNSLGGILGLISLVLGLIPIYHWLI